MPYFLAVSPDEKLAVVGNRLPADDASQPANGTAGPTSRYVTGQGSSAADDPTAVELVIGDRPAAYGMGLARSISQSAAASAVARLTAD
jgi:hypothetical protein